MNFNTEHKSVKSLLDNRFYQIPPFQREYTWGKEQWENFINDLFENAEGYFIGTIICIEKGNNHYSVIDGQQRLITISILLNVINKIILEINEKYQELKILDMSSNKKNATLYGSIENMIIKEDKFTVTPQIQKNNKDDYFYLCYEKNKFGNITVTNESRYYTSRKIYKSFNFFYSYLNNEIKSEDDIYKIFAFSEKVLNSVVVKIIVNNSSDAFTLFESINNRGVPLSAIDLIKNSFFENFAKTSSEKENDKVIEECNTKWKTLIDNIGDYSDQEKYLRHYYHATQKTRLAKSSIIKEYEILIKKDFKLLFNNLIEKSKSYNLLFEPENINDNPKLQHALINLKHLGISPAYAFLLFLFSKHKDFPYKIEMLELLEGWFIKRHLTDKPATRDLDTLFVKLIKEIDDTKVELILETTKKYLKEHMEIDEVVNSRLCGDIYSDNASLTRYVLLRLEQSKDGDKQVRDFWKMTLGKKPDWTVEHIYPQNPKRNEDWSAFNSEDKEKYLNMLGNLTVTAYNPELSNKSFVEKRDAKDKDNHAIGYKSNIKINEDLVNETEWSPEKIELRTKKLAQEVSKLFFDKLV